VPPEYVDAVANATTIDAKNMVSLPFFFLLFKRHFFFSPLKKTALPKKKK